MKKVIFFLLFSVILTVNSGGNTYAGEINHYQSNQLSNTYIVSFSDDVDTKLINDLGGKVIKKYKYSSTIVVELPDNALEALENHSSISSVEIDGLVETTGIEVNAMIQTTPWNIERINASSVHGLGYTGKGVKIGVIDSGIMTNHEDLKVVGGINIIDNNYLYDDDYGHGTRVAGTIAALDNEKGIVGVAPNAELYAIKVLDNKGKGSISNLISGIEWAIDQKLNIVNLSLETKIDNKALKRIIKEAYRKGIVLVSASGNTGSNDKKSTVTYPAVYDEVIAVGALDDTNIRATFSSVGTQLDLMAPGVNVYTTIPRGYYFVFSGTSIAAPHVAGTAALLLESHPNLSNKQIEKALYNSSTPLGEKFYYGKGGVDALMALKYVNKH